MEMATEAGFTAWVAGFRTRAMAAGITPQTFDAAFRDARPGSTMAKPESG
jgi:membrane-bound lytic murein transglycosylase B